MVPLQLATGLRCGHNVDRFLLFLHFSFLFRHAVVLSIDCVTKSCFSNLTILLSKWGCHMLPITWPKAVAYARRFENAFLWKMFVSINYFNVFWSLYSPELQDFSRTIPADHILGRQIVKTFLFFSLLSMWRMQALSSLY